jgi:hypothetical protein
LVLFFPLFISINYVSWYLNNNITQLNNYLAIKNTKDYEKVYLENQVLVSKYSSFSEDEIKNLKLKNNISIL